MRKSIWAIMSFLLLLCCAPALLAQSPGTATKEENIRKILIQTDARGVFKRELETQINAKRKEVSNVPAKFWDEFLKEIDTEKFVELLIPIYERHFSNDELTQLIAFYETPLGKKMVATLPQIVAESAAAGGKYGEDVALKVIKRMRAAGTFPDEKSPPKPNL